MRQTRHAVSSSSHCAFINEWLAWQTYIKNLQVTITQVNRTQKTQRMSRVEYTGHVWNVFRTHPSTQRSQISVCYLTQIVIAHIQKQLLRLLRARCKRSGSGTASVCIFMRELLCIHAAEWRLLDNILFWQLQSCVYLHSKIQWICEF